MSRYANLTSHKTAQNELTLSNIRYQTQKRNFYRPRYVWPYVYK